MDVQELMRWGNYGGGEIIVVLRLWDWGLMEIEALWKWDNYGVRTDMEVE